MYLDLTGGLLAGRLSAGLILASGAWIEAVLARHPGVPAGPGLAAAAVLLAWHLRQRRRAPTAAEFDAGGWRLRLSGGRWVDARLHRSSRLVGTTIALRWLAGGRSYGAWLTPFDLAPHRLRSLAARLVVQAARTSR